MKSHRPRKRFGQNFLRNDRIIHDIVAAIAPRPGQHLVEIGPGQGALTRPLLDAGTTLDVVELDRDLLPGLEALTTERQRFRIWHLDALELDLVRLAAGERLRIVGNLPYNISTPLIFKLLGQIEAIADMHFMLQKEVVARLAAGPGGRDYGRLSVMVQHLCDVEALFDVGPEAFDPVPRVTSACVRLLPRPAPAVVDEHAFATVVRQAFGQRRKTLRNTLRGLLDEAGIRACGIDPGLRPEQIPVVGFESLACMLSGSGPAPLRGQVVPD